MCQTIYTPFERVGLNTNFKEKVHLHEHVLHKADVCLCVCVSGSVIIFFSDFTNFRANYRCLSSV